MSDDTHPVLRMLAFQCLVLLIGLGVFFAFLLGATVAEGGKTTLDMTQFGEMWIEYWAMMGIVAVAPWTLFWADRRYRE